MNKKLIILKFPDNASLEILQNTKRYLDSSIEGYQFLLISKSVEVLTEDDKDCVIVSVPGGDITLGSLIDYINNRIQEDKNYGND